MTMTFTRLKERGKWGTFMSQCLRSLTLMLFFFIQTTLLCANATLENSDEFTCYARFEHVDVKHTDCGKRNGKLIVDPNVNAGTRMPYRVRYQYNGRWYWKGPFTSWGDSYISNLPAGTYRNVTLVDARNCKYNAGHFKIKENCANRCTAKFEHVNVKHADCGQSNGEIIVDPHINSGTKLPFYVKLTYNGIPYQFGPFRKNRDYAIKNLSAGIYRNVTLIDANGCEDNEGNVEIRSEGGLKDGGYVSETQRGCAPFDPVPFIGSVCAPGFQVEYQWQIKRDRNGYWENIAGAKQKNYNPGVHPEGSVWYRRAARIKNCGTWAYSNVVDIHVEGPCTRDCTVELGPNQELCDGPLTITPSIDGDLDACTDCADRNLNGMMYLGTYEGNEYYKRTGGDIKYKDALAFATNRGGSLPIIRNAGQNAWLAQQVGDRFWLGLTDTRREGTFKWNDGSALTYTNWNHNEPNDYGSGEDYVEMLPNGKWNDLGDHHIRWVIVCFPVCDPNNSQATYAWSGPNNFSSSDAEIVVAKSGKYCLTVTDCNGTVCTDCVEITGGYLVDGGRINKTQRGCAPFDPNPFIGSEVPGDVIYQWQIKRDKNGRWENIVSANDINYDPGVHSLGSVWYRRAVRTEGCGDWAHSNSVDIHVDEPCVQDCTVDLGPDQELCDGTIFLAAEVDGNLDDCTPCQNRDLSTMMHLGTYEGQEYYKVLTGDVKYNEAYVYATNRGGSLPIIRNSGQNAWLAQKVGGRFWLGLTDTQKEGTFKWNDGSSLTYKNWNNNEPNDWGNGEDYVEMLTNGKWNDLGAHHKRWIVVCFPVCDPGQVGPKYQWEGPGNFVSQQASIEITQPGKYCLTVTDCNGTVCNDCVEISGSYLVDGGQIEETQRGCAPFDPVPFIGSTVAGDVTYQWQIKQVMNGQWENIDAANGKDYDPGVHPEGSVWYRRAVRLNNSCGTWKYSNSVDVHVKGSPVVTVTSTNPECDANDGTITFSFDDRSDRTNIEFKIVSEGSVIGHFDQNNSKDDAGSYTVDGLASGTYQLYTRWGNNECEVDLGEVTIEEEFEDLKDGGQIEETQRGCAPFDPVPFIGSTVAGDVTYQWQIKQVMNGQWENIDAANGKDYDPGVHPEGSVWYRRAVRLNNSCGTWKYSNSVDVHVKGSPVVTVTSTNPECDANDGTITFSFDDRSDRTNIEFKIVSEGSVIGHFDQNNSKDDAGSYTVDGLASGTYQLYTRWGNNECEVDLGEVTLTEERDELTDGGQISATQKACGGFDPVPFIGEALSHPSGIAVLYQWQIKVDKNTGDWTDIPAATSKDYDAPYQESGSVWYRRSATLDNACGNMVYSNSVDIHVLAPPVVEVTTTNPDCIGDNGIIHFSFSDNDSRTNIEFELRQNGTVLKAFDNHMVVDDAGTYAIDGLTAGNYEVYTRWGNNECEVDLGTINLAEPGCASLGDYVWEDVNGNGQQEDNEPGVANVNVQLNDATGKAIDQTSTDGQGYYSFNDLNAGTYSVQFELPNGYKFTTPNNGDDNSDSDADPSLNGMTAIVTLGAGEHNPTLDAGILVACEEILVTIDGDQAICEDPDVTTTLTANVPDNINVVSYLWNTDATTASITVQPTETTDYHVIITDDKGCTGQAVFTVEVYENIKNGGEIGPNQANCGPFDPAVIENVTLPDNGDSDRALEYVWLKTNDIKAGVTPGSTNWEDYENWDHIPGTENLTAYDPGMLFQTTYFLRCVRRAGCIDYSGESNVITIEVFDEPTVEAFGGQVICQDADVYAEISASSSGGTGTVTYAWSNGMTGATISVQPTETTTYVVTGTDQNGCSATAEVTVEVHENIKNGGEIGPNQSACGPFDAAPITNVTLPDNGDSDRPLEYIWLKTNDLKPGATPGSTYWDDYENWDHIPGSTDPMSLDPGVLTETTYFLRCVRRNGCIDYTGESNVVIIEVLACANLGDYVWVDANENGIQDGDESPVANVAVYLLNGNGKELALTQTDDNGLYLFPNLMPGNYQVKVVAPDSYSFTSQGAGTDGAVDSDVDANGFSQVATLSGADILTLDAGLVEVCEAYCEMVPTGTTLFCVNQNFQPFYPIEAVSANPALDIVPTGFQVIYLLIDQQDPNSTGAGCGTGDDEDGDEDKDDTIQYVIKAASNSPYFEIPVSQKDVYCNGPLVCSIHCLVYSPDPSHPQYFDVNMIEYGTTTIEDLAYLISDAGVCAYLDESGATYRWEFCLNFERNTQGISVEKSSNVEAVQPAEEVNDLESAPAEKPKFELFQNRPNPFMTETTIGFTLSKAGAATIEITDMTGQAIRQIADEYPAGYHEVTIQRGNLPYGVLQYTFTAEGIRMTKRMMVVE